MNTNFFLGIRSKQEDKKDDIEQGSVGRPHSYAQYRQVQGKGAAELGSARALDPHSLDANTGTSVEREEFYKEHTDSRTEVVLRRQCAMQTKQ